jgi:hypothetical protein
MDFKVRDCNYRDTRGTGKCQYRGVCRVSIIIYKITCNMMNKIYIGNTQQNFKKRMSRSLPGCQRAHGKGSPLGLLCKTFHRYLTERSRITITRNAAGPNKMQHFVARKPNLGGQKFRQNPPMLCATENRWKSSNFPDPSLINLSTLVPKSIEHADTNQGSIGISSMHR